MKLKAATFFFIFSTIVSFSQKLTIQTSGNALSKEEVEKMVAESEKFKEEDEKFRNKIEAKNKLEGMVYGMKTTLTEEKLKAAVPEDEMTKFNSFVEDTLKWMEEEHTQEEYEEKQKELNDVFQPMKYMKPDREREREREEGMPEDMPQREPKIEEVD
jgi:L1 cell adhesion molecule like protein